jgi:Kef-type K+ transport system membrane component KefB
MSSLPQLLLLLSLAVLLAKVAGWIATRLGQSAVLGELLVGLVMGPTVLDVLNMPGLAGLDVGVTINHMAEIGVILLMLIAGMEVDLQDLRRSGWSALLGGISGVAVTIGAAWSLSRLFGYNAGSAFAIGVLVAATSVSISAQTLLELGVLRRPEGIALLGAGVVDDILVILLLSVLLGFDKGGGTGGILLIVGRMALFLLVGGALCLWGLPWLMRRVERWPVSAAVPAAALIATFFIAWAADVLGGVGGITGAFLVGLGLRRTSLHHSIAGAIHTIGYALFVPLFFISVGLHANVRSLDPGRLVFGLALIAVAITAKVAANTLGAWAGGLPRRSALRMGLGMIPRGEVSLIAATVEVAEGWIGPGLFAIVMLLVLTTTLLTPMVLRVAFRRDRPLREPPGTTAP